MEVILASRSPRRLMLLQSAGLAVEVRPSHIDETPLAGESVAEIVQRLCKGKALACESTTPVIAADTLVAINGEPLGQAANLGEAKKMLLKLSGQTHHVYTGVCVRLGNTFLTDLVRTEVRFRVITGQEIDIYLAHNEVLDKAGSYAIQGGAASFIESIDGQLDNVIGLPVRQTMNMLTEITFPEHKGP